MTARAPIGLIFLALLVNANVLADQPLLDLKSLDRDRVLKPAEQFLSEKPVTVTAQSCPRSAGGAHDFFSEGDYWWPNPKDPAGPYVQRDGMTNPENFVAHRLAMIRLATHVGTLTSAWRITGERKYADKAIEHLRAWFVNSDTRMNPNLQYAQAIKGITTGRGIGIIDTIHLIEVARSAQILQAAGILSGQDLEGTKRWFADYLTWLTTSKNGTDEMKAKNNHGTCWVMQVAAFASFTGDEKLLALCRKRFEEVLLPNQMAADGSFPQELRRTKPYSYSLFNLDAMATICRICSWKEENLWEFTTGDGRGMRKAIEFMYPFVREKSKWPHKPDVMFYEFWPVRSPALLFAGMAYHEPKYVELWKGLEANPTNEEVIRNLPLRQPVLWVE
ncbi:MAG TPA: alginate lyase family protein [Tepidisphaeraceae bacterium]